VLDSNLFVTLPGEITDITVRTLARLADALQVSTDYLLGRKGEESEHMPAAVALASA
jgi:transcriptional regulator with XRE-family HTH domain